MSFRARWLRRSVLSMPTSTFQMTENESGLFLRRWEIPLIENGG